MRPASPSVEGRSSTTVFTWQPSMATRVKPYAAHPQILLPIVCLVVSPEGGRAESFRILVVLAKVTPRDACHRAALGINPVAPRLRREMRRWTRDRPGWVTPTRRTGRVPGSSGAGRKRLLMNHDRGRGHAVTLHQAEQDCSVLRIEPHATVRGRAAEMGDFVAAVDSEAAIKEDRMRHRRIVIFAREPTSRQHFRMIGAGRRDMAAPRRRYGPVVARHAVDAHRHALRRAVDLHDNGGVGAAPQRGKQQRGDSAAQVTHGMARQP